MTWEREREAAIQSVLEACTLCRVVQSAHLSKQKMDKSDGSPVTVADLGGQALVAHHLKKTLSDDPLMGEEDSGLLLREENTSLRHALMRHVNQIVPTLDEEQILAAIDRGNAEGGPEGRFWVLDPVDGTKGFLRGEQYAVALALVADGEVVLGVLGCPNLPLKLDHPGSPRGCLFVAVKEEGTTMRALDAPEEHRVMVSNLENPSEILIAQSFESNHSSHAECARVAHILGITKESIRMDGQGKYGLLARGDVSTYLRIPTPEMYVENIWDHAAGTIIVQEAGGRVTDLDGKPLDFSQGKRLAKNRGIVATNGRIHDEVLEAVKQVAF